MLMSTREAFGKMLAELGARDERIVVLDADLATSTRVDIFAKKFPGRFFEMGIAEQNMVGYAAGLASMGFVPVVSTFAAFASRRACDQVSISVAYPKMNVKIVGAYGGSFCGKGGATHQAYEDIAIMRAIPNMIIISPVDGIETQQALAEAIEYDGPVYFRTARPDTPTLFAGDYRFEIGRGVVLREGEDVAMISTGILTLDALEAAGILQEQGIEPYLLHVPTLKPLDREAVVRAATTAGVVVTVEDHSVIGGLGSAVAEVLSRYRPTYMAMVGMEDRFGESGADAELKEKYGLNAAGIAKKAVQMYRAKKGL
ncbi:MAG: transketolase C-terminal domain-containing protein [Bacillota bacterium]